MMKFPNFNEDDILSDDKKILQIKNFMTVSQGLWLLVLEAFFNL